MKNEINIILKETQTPEEIEEDNKTRTNLSEKYFQNVNIKHLRKILFTTPYGNKCECYINKNPNSLLGSMVITKVNGIDTEQFVHGMPKLHYYNDYLTEIEKDTRISENKSYACYIEMIEKVDGTNICLYKLHDPTTGQVIEIIPKTRNMPILSIEFQKLYNKIRNINLTNYLHLHDEIHSILFEMSGYENLHGIKYNYPLRLHILGFYDKEYNLSTDYGELYETKIIRPPVIGYINKNKDNWDYNIFTDYLLNQKNSTNIIDNMMGENPNLEDLLNEIVEKFETINQKYKNNNVKDGFCTEGTILNLHINNRLLYMKLKPTSIKEAQTLSNGIPSPSIRKEVLKFFDEYGKQEATRIVEEEIKIGLSFIQDNLKEEYSEEYIYTPQTRKKIKRLLIEHTQRKAIKSELLNISKKIINENPNVTDISGLMRIFAKEYPDLKHQSGEMFNAFKETI